MSEDFCRDCGAHKPPIPGEGTCEKCDPEGVARNVERTLDRTLRDLPRFTMKYPDFVTKEYGGTSQGFRVAHRRKLRAAQKALAEAFRGCAWAGDFEQLDMAQHAVRKAIDMCRPVNWEKAKPLQELEGNVDAIAGHHVVVRKLERALRSTNPRFDADRFVAAAKGTPTTGRDRPR